MVDKGLKSCGLRVVKEIKPLGPNKGNTPPEQVI